MTDTTDTTGAQSLPVEAVEAVEAVVSNPPGEGTTASPSMTAIADDVGAIRAELCRLALLVDHMDRGARVQLVRAPEDAIDRAEHQESDR